MDKDKENNIIKYLKEFKMKTVGEMKKEVSAKLDYMEVELNEILDNLEDEEKKHLICLMSEVDASYPVLYDIKDFDNVLKDWSPSKLITSAAYNIYRYFNDVDSFYIDESEFICDGDDYANSYYSIYAVKEYLERYNYDVPTKIDAVDYWEEKYRGVLNFQEELETFADEEVFDEDDYEDYDGSRRLKCGIGKH